MNKARRLFLIVIVLPGLLAACYPSHYRTAPGAQKTELAKIRVHGAMYIATIDGEKLPETSFALMPRKWDDFYLNPGRYTLEVGYFRYNTDAVESSRKYRTIPLDLKPGEIKTLCPGVLRNRLGRVTGWDPHVADFPNFNPDSMWWQAKYRRSKVPEKCE